MIQYAVNLELGGLKTKNYRRRKYSHINRLTYTSILRKTHEKHLCTGNKTCTDTFQRLFSLSIDVINNTEIFAATALVFHVPVCDVQT